MFASKNMNKNSFLQIDFCHKIPPQQVFHYIAPQV